MMTTFQTFARTVSPLVTILEANQTDTLVDKQSWNDLTFAINGVILNKDPRKDSLEVLERYHGH